MAPEQNHRFGAIPEQATVEIEGFPAGTFPTPRCTFDVLDGHGKGEHLNFKKTVIRVGSDVLNDIVLSDPTVSRRHAEIRYEDGAYRLVDLGSTNGTFVDDKRINDVYLETVTNLSFGKTPVAFEAHIEGKAIEPSPSNRYGHIVGQNAGLRQIFAVIDKVAPSNLHVVITGETGTGKELFARAIHEGSRRAEHPLVIFDCSAFPPTLLESELFGHEKGSFSGATQQHQGVFERADKGTLFLDELGEMSVELQPKLLRAIETGEFRRVGGTKSIQTNVRVVAATNRDLEDWITEGRFRRDLYYRLAQVRFRLPPLRERLDDIPLLIESFMESARKGLSATSKTQITPQAIALMQSYSWPGNIRELKNLVERGVTLCDDERITAAFVQDELGLAPGAALVEREEDDSVLPPILEGEDGELIPLREAKDQLVADFEKKYLEKLLGKHKQNISAAAREAQVDRRHFYRLLKKYGLDRE